MIFLSQIAAAQNRCTYVPPTEAENIILPTTKGIHSHHLSGNTLFALDNTMLPSKGSAALSDTLGNLLLVSNGNTVYDETISAIGNGSNLHGNVGSAQPGIFVPQPDNPDKVYFFTTDVVNRLPIPELEDKGFNYHVIDLSGDRKHVSTKNVSLLEHCTEKVSAVKHQNGRDVWIAAHDWGNSDFYIYKLTADSLEDKNPAPQSIGQVHDYTEAEQGDPNIFESQNSTGVMKFSPSGDKLALALTGDGTVEIFDFDNATGTLSNPILLEANTLKGAFGLEFSPEEKYLYVTATGVQSSTNDNLLFQMDITSGNPSDILSSLELLNESPLEGDVNSLQLTAKRQILVARDNGNYAGLIENPDRPMPLCNYREDAFETNLSGRVVSLTNFASHYLDIPPFTWDTKCFGDQTVFQITNTANTDTVLWDFGELAGKTDLSNPFSPSHVYSEAGNYPVSMTLVAEGESYVYTDTVTIHALPEPNLGQDRYVFPGSSIVLSPGDFYGYEWGNPGSTDHEIRVSESGTYNVTVEDTNCCKNADTVDIVFVPLTVPTAIRPRSGIAENRTFMMSGMIEGLSNFEMYIYNRWGQLLFETENRAEGWDGTFNGDMVQTGTYTYVIRFVITDEEMNERDILRKGTVVVLE